MSRSSSAATARAVSIAFPPPAPTIVRAERRLATSATAAISRPGRSNYRLVGPVFESFDFGIVVPAGSPLRERFNAVILTMKEDGAIDTIIDRWLGTSE